MPVLPRNLHAGASSRNRVMTFKMKQSIFSFWKRVSVSRLWLGDKPRGSFVSLPSDGINVELLCCVSQPCLISPGILIVLCNSPL